MQTVLVSIIALAILVVFLQEVHTRHEAHDTAVELAINELSKRIVIILPKSISITTSRLQLELKSQGADPTDMTCRRPLACTGRTQLVGTLLG